MAEYIAMNRRLFLKQASCGVIAAGTMPFVLLPEGKTHILTLSFDDGFKNSCYKIAGIFEEFGLKASMNVIASGHLPTFKNPDEWILQELLGNFDDWNILKERGHEIMPHSWEHANLTKMPFKEATERIDKCLSYFEEHLDGFKSSEAVFNFPFNASTPEIEKYTLSKVKAVRTGSESAVNKIPASSGPVRLTCKSMGNEKIDGWVENEINRFLFTGGGWLILNTHGLDEEGWGPMSSANLRRLLKRLVKMNHLAVLPVAEVVNQV